MNAITTAPFAAGLSNQKLALAALVLTGRTEGRAVMLPHLLDFQPDSTACPPRTYGDIFDLAAFEAVVQVPLASSAQEYRDPTPLFRAMTAEIGLAQQAGTLRDHPGLSLLAAMRPEVGLAARIEEARRRFHEMGGRIVCQMRLERDWVNYMEAYLTPRLSETQDLSTDPIAIAKKIAGSFGPEIGPILVTCDLKGLDTTPESITETVERATGLRLVFKHDLLNDDISLGPLAASLIDFELMVSAEQIAGTTLSSFFGLASLTRLARDGVSATAWAYNVHGSFLLKRTDNGAFANLQRATADGSGL